MGSKKGRVERLVYHGMIYLSRGRSTPKLVSGMGLTHIKGIRISVDFPSIVNSHFRIKSTILKISPFCKVHLIEEFKLHLSMLITSFNF